MRRLISATGLCALGVLLLGWSGRVVSEDTPKLAVPPQPTPVAGRFQMMAAGGQLFLLDTSTGQVWKHDSAGKTDEQFFEPKVKTDADWGATPGGPTYRGKPLGFWLALLRDQDPEYQEQGMEGVSHFGEQARAALPDLLRIFLKSLPDSTDEGIAYCIARIDPRHEGLRAMLGHKDIALRRASAIAMARLGDVDPNRHPGQKVGRVRPQPDEPQPDEESEPERERQFKWRLPGDKDAIPVLVEMLRDREPLNDDLSYAAISLYALATYKTDAVVAVPEVTKLLTDKDATFRQLAVKVLAEVAPTAKETLTAARAALKDADAQVRAVAARVIGQLGDRESLPALKALMKDADPDVRQGVVQAFGCFKDDAGTLVPILVEVVRTPDSKLRMHFVNPDGSQQETSDPREVRAVSEAFTSLAKFGPAAKAAVPELVKQASKSGVFTHEARLAIRKIAPDEWKKLKPPTQVGPSPAPAGYSSSPIPPPPPDFVRPTARPNPR